MAEIQNKINDIMIFMSTCIVYETVHFLRIALVIILKESLRQASISIHRSLKQNRNKTNNVQGLGCSAQSKACPSKHLYCTLESGSVIFCSEICCNSVIICSLNQLRG